MPDDNPLDKDWEDVRPDGAKPAKGSKEAKAAKPRATPDELAEWINEAVPHLLQQTGESNSRATWTLHVSTEKAPYSGAKAVDIGCSGETLKTSLTVMGTKLRDLIRQKLQAANEVLENKQRETEAQRIRVEALRDLLSRVPSMR